MHKYLYIILILLPIYSYSTTYPVDGDTLSQTQIMIQWDEMPKANAYILKIKENNVKIIYNDTVKSLAKLVHNVFQYGNSYTWTITGLNDKAAYINQFSASFYIKNNTVNLATSITKKNINTAHNKGIIILDGCGAAIDMAGNVVWLLEQRNLKSIETGISFRNMQINKQGNITTLLQSNFLECNLQGTVLWQAPKKGIYSNDSIEPYHHDGVRLSNGNYLIASYQYEKEPCYTQPKDTCTVQYGTLLEYNQQQKLVWKWSEKNTIDPKFVYKDYEKGNSVITGSHLNGFNIYDNKIITSYRDNNRLAIHDKNTGALINEYYPTPAVQYEGQHSPTIINDSTILYYNNNLSRANKNKLTEELRINATVIIANTTKNSLIKKWEYEIKSDSFPEGTTGKEGGIQLLPNGNYLICVGGKHRLLIVTPEQEIDWDCYLYRYNEMEKKQNPMPSYRAHYYSSLYPNYYTIQKSYTAQVHTIKINNDGTDENIFLITTSNKKITYRYITPKVQPNSSTIVKLPKGVTKINVSINGILGNTITVKL